MLLKKQFSFFLSSDPESGATNVAVDGSSFQVNFNSPIMIPPNAVSAELSVIQANVWNDSANISACLLYTSPSPRDATLSRMPSSA